MTLLALSLDLQRRERDRLSHALKANCDPDKGFPMTMPQRRTVLLRLLELDHAVKDLERQAKTTTCPSP